MREGRGRDRRCRKGDGERSCEAVHGNGGGRPHPGCLRTCRAHPRFPPLTAGELLSDHARGRSDDTGRAPREPRDPLPPARFGTEATTGGDALSDALDEEEEINQQAGNPYSIYPCPPPGPYPARAVVLRIIDPRVPACRRQADALQVSFDARRVL